MSSLGQAHRLRYHSQKLLGQFLQIFPMLPYTLSGCPAYSDVQGWQPLAKVQQPSTSPTLIITNQSCMALPALLLQSHPRWYRLPATETTRLDLAWKCAGLLRLTWSLKRVELRETDIGSKTSDLSDPTVPLLPHYSNELRQADKTMCPHLMS